MSEDKTLEQRVKDLEDEQKGLELALLNLVTSICANGEIHIPSVAANFAKLNNTLLKTYSLSGPAANKTIERIQELFDVQAQVLEEKLGDKYK